MVREGHVLDFEVLDARRFLLAALDAPGARYFAGTGASHDQEWPSALQTALREPAVDRWEARATPTYAFELNEASRPALTALLKAHPRSWWFYHWWVYSDDALLVSCYDWDGGPHFLHLSLRNWAEQLQREGLVRITGSTVFTDDWFEQTEREFRERGGALGCCLTSASSRRATALG